MGIKERLIDLLDGMQEKFDDIDVELLELREERRKLLAFVRATLRYAETNGDDFLANEAALMLAKFKEQCDE
jgi:hypothetical protein